MVSGFRCQQSEGRGQSSENREPQKTESAGGGKVEGKENFIISASGGFDINYSKQGKLMGYCHLTPDTRLRGRSRSGAAKARNLKPKIGLCPETPPYLFG